MLTAGVTAAFYFILKALNTANLIPSTVSVATSFLAAYLTFRRSPLYAVAYAANDIVLIVLWVMATLDDIGYISVVVCFAIFLASGVLCHLPRKRPLRLFQLDSYAQKTERGGRENSRLHPRKSAGGSPRTQRRKRLKRPFIMAKQTKKPPFRANEGAVFVLLMCRFQSASSSSARAAQSSEMLAGTEERQVMTVGMTVTFFCSSRRARMSLPDIGAQEPFSMMPTFLF